MRITKRISNLIPDRKSFSSLTPVEHKLHVPIIYEKSEGVSFLLVEQN